MSGSPGLAMWGVVKLIRSRPSKEQRAIDKGARQWDRTMKREAKR